MSGGVSLYVGIVVVLNILACLWLIWWSTRQRGAAPAKNADGSPSKTGHVWDGDLEEYNNPLPRWWLGLFLITIVFGFIYLALYPGLGAFRGELNWSSVGQYKIDEARAEKTFEARLAPLAGLSLTQLSSNAQAMGTAANLYAQNCSACHGSDARGARGFPNLTDHDWLYGGEPETIYQTIAQGRNGIMPALGDALGGEQGVADTAAYVLSLSGRSAPSGNPAAGKAHFEVLCAACHGADGKGNQAIGAPNLTDQIWLWGGSPATVRETIAKGRNNQMPAHLEKLGEAKVRLLAAYIYSLSAKSP